MTLRIFWSVLCLTTIMAIGCKAPPPPSGPTQMRVQVADRDEFLEAAMTSLREMDFQPARLDREKGELITQPSTSGQWFEFWRRDVRGGYQALEANLHTMRRSITVRLSRDESSAEDGEEYVLAVQVDKDKYSAPERQITTASGALGIYSVRVPSETGQRGPNSGGVQWIPVGRDPLLEQYVLNLLARHAGAVLGAVSSSERTHDEPDHRSPD